MGDIARNPPAGSIPARQDQKGQIGCVYKEAPQNTHRSHQVEQQKGITLDFNFLHSYLNRRNVLVCPQVQLKGSPSLLKQKSDVVIVGSGISGLTSAILLLRKGYSVKVLEAHYKPGGYMHSFEKMGHLYDSGAHYVGALQEKEPFWALLNYLDVYSPETFCPLDEEAFDTFHFRNQRVSEVSFGKGYDRVIDHFSKKFPKDKGNIKNFFQELKVVARNFPTYEFLVDYDQQSLLRSLETSLQKAVEKYISNPELHSALYAYCGLHGVMPGEVSFGLHAVIVDSLIRSGGYGFRGSGDALAQRFVNKIESLGGEIILRENATCFEVDNGKVQSVVTRRGNVYPANQFIFCGHPKHMLELAGEEHFRKPYRQRILNTPESIGIMGLYGVAKRKAVPEIKRNYYHLDKPLPMTMIPDQPVNDAPLISFMTFPDRETPETDAEVAFSVHAPQFYSWVEEWKHKKGYSRDETYHRLKDKMAQKALASMDHFGFSMTENTLRFETSTTLTNKRFNLSPEGSAYGIYHSISYTGARALSGRTKIENLFVSGQNTLFPGIMAASIAGMRTTGFMIGIKEHIANVRSLMDS